MHSTCLVASLALDELTANHTDRTTTQYGKHLWVTPVLRNYASHVITDIHSQLNSSPQGLASPMVTYRSARTLPSILIARAELYLVVTADVNPVDSVHRCFKHY
jgi:hypothetical protein